MSWQTLSTTSPELQKQRWLRPERADQRARIAVIGGNANFFERTQAIYAQLSTQQLQQLAVFLPKKLEKLLPQSDFLHFIGSGSANSFNAEAWGNLLVQSRQFDTVFIASDISNNSETVLGLQNYLKNSSAATVLDFGLSQVLEQSSVAAITLLDLKDIQLLTRKEKLPKTVTSQSSLEDIQTCLDLLFDHFQSTLVFEQNQFVFVRSNTEAIRIKGQLNAPSLVAVLGENYLPQSKAVAISVI